MSQTGQEAVDVSQCGSNGRLNLEVGRWPLLTVGGVASLFGFVRIDADLTSQGGASRWVQGWSFGDFRLGPCCHSAGRPSSGQISQSELSK